MEFITQFIVPTVGFTASLISIYVFLKTETGHKLTVLIISIIISLIICYSASYVWSKHAEQMLF